MTWSDLRRAADRLGVGLTPHMVEQLRRYWEALEAANARLNLTRIRGEGEFLEKHILDALSAVSTLGEGVSGPLVDVGSGCGVPGIPLAVVLGSWRVVLIESKQRKAAFLRQVARAFGLRVEVRCQRAEEAGRDTALRERCGVGVVRALGSVSTCLELALPLVRPGGSVLLFRGPSHREEDLEIARVIAPLLGGGPPVSHNRTLPGGAGRHDILVAKVSATPDRYPRRPGEPHKRPLP